MGGTLLIKDSAGRGRVTLQNPPHSLGIGLIGMAGNKYAAKQQQRTHISIVAAMLLLLLLQLL